MGQQFLIPDYENLPGFQNTRKAELDIFKKGRKTIYCFDQSASLGLNIF